MQLGMEIDGMWIIESTGKSGRTVYRVDRKKYPNMKWSYNIAHAFQYRKEEIATLHCSYYKFGNPKVRELDKSDEFIIAIHNIFAEVI
jgi:hypothetical protein